MRTTQRKGDLATASAVARFTRMGFDVSIPLTESAAYDLVVDDGEGLRRVQCKYCGAARGQVDLRQIHSNSGGYVVKLVPPNAYDWLYILAADGCEYLIKECLHGRRSVGLHAAHRLGAVAESG
jgi:PD-(D/E)XK endonuclease